MTTVLTDLGELDLAAPATLEQIKAAWQRVALFHHPDHGGDAEVFRRKLEAYRRLIRQRSEPEGCAACQGTGRVLVARGFSSVQLWCEACDGSGEIGQPS